MGTFFFISCLGETFESFLRSQRVEDLESLVARAAKRNAISRHLSWLLADEWPRVIYLYDVRTRQVAQNTS